MHGLLRWWALSWCALAVVACSPAVNPLQPKVVVQWQTASEVNTAGFNIYRSDNRDGPYAKLNDRLIPPSSNPLSGGTYRYEDATAMPGQTYYYRLEDVELNGVSTRHEPMVLAVPQPFGGLGPAIAALVALALLGIGAWGIRVRR